MTKKKTKTRVTTIVIPSVMKRDARSHAVIKAEALDAVILENSNKEMVHVSEAEAPRQVIEFKGSNKKLSDMITEYLQEDLLDLEDGIFKNIKNIKDSASKARLKLELMKLIVPKAISEEEKEALKKNNDQLNRLYFPQSGQGYMRIEESEIEEE